MIHVQESLLARRFNIVLQLIKLTIIGSVNSVFGFSPCKLSFGGFQFFRDGFFCQKSRDTSSKLKQEKAIAVWEFVIAVFVVILLAGMYLNLFNPLLAKTVFLIGVVGLSTTLVFGLIAGIVVSR